MREILAISEDFKDSPLGNVPKQWEVNRLSTRASVFGGKRLPFGHLYSDTPTEFRYLRVLDFFEQDINFENLEFLNPSTFKALERYEIHESALFISIAGSLGYAGVFKPPNNQRTILTENAARIILQDDSIPEFLAYQINSFIVQKQIEAEKGTGGGVPKLALFRIENLFLAFPPREEQKKIVTILKTIDQAIARTSSLIAKLKQMKAGLLHDLLTRGLDENGKLRDAIAYPEQFKDSPLGQIPNDWDTSILDKIINIIDCKHYTPKYVSNGIPIVRPRNVKVDGLDFSDIDYVSEKEYKLLTDKHTPRQGDIVFSRNASFGIPCYVNTTQCFAIGQDVVIMTELSANTRFVYYTLISGSIEKQIQNVSAGSTFGRINLACIRELIVPVPPREEQDKIANILDTYDIRIRQEGAYQDKLKFQKKGLMQDLLTGKVRVN